MYPNPKDFTPKEVYKEMDRQTRYYRKERLVINVLMIVTAITVFATMIALIKRL